jgi:hypothetical protein
MTSEAIDDPDGVYQIRKCSERECTVPDTDPPISPIKAKFQILSDDWLGYISREQKRNKIQLDDVRYAHIKDSDRLQQLLAEKCASVADAFSAITAFSRGSYKELNAFLDCAESIESALGQSTAVSTEDKKAFAAMKSAGESFVAAQDENKSTLQSYRDALTDLQSTLHMTAKATDLVVQERARYRQERDASRVEAARLQKRADDLETELTYLRTHDPSDVEFIDSQSEGDARSDL